MLKIGVLNFFWRRTFSNTAVTRQLEKDVRRAHDYLEAKMEKYLEKFQHQRAHFARVKNLRADNLAIIDELNSITDTITADLTLTNVEDFTEKCTQLASYINQER